MADAVAIDFGTSRTKLAYWDDQSHEARLMHLGYYDQPFVPSLFYLVRDSEQILWGQAAEEMLTEDPAGMVEVLKRHLQDRYLYANRRKVSPQQLLTLLFGQLRTRAGEELTAFQGKLPRKALLTMPAVYGPAVEKLLQEAARAAGFAEVELVSEPVAAARAWLAETATADPAVVVLDCGGGTLDLAYLRYRDGEFQLVPECPPTGDMHISGYDVDLELLRLVREKAEAMDEEIKSRQAFYLHQVRLLKERYCRGLPLRPLRVQGHEIKLTAQDFQAIFEDRFIRQACESLKSYLARVAAINHNRLPTVLLVGGSARLMGLRESVESQCGCKAFGWERAEFATVLGAVATSVIKPILPKTQNIHGWSAPQVQALQQQTAQGLKVAVEFRDPLKDGRPGPEMLVIPAGEFLMGSPDNEPGRYETEGPQHKVVIAKPFAIGRYAVTFEEYDRFCEATERQPPDDQGWGRGRRPVINVSWEEAVAYCTWLSQETGASYRLPSEAEWEYAARAGTTTAFWWGNDSDTTRADYDGNYVYQNGWKGEDREQTVPVDTFQPNPFGLYQVHGNVWEWVQDAWHENYDGAPVDGSAWVEKDNDLYVLRGGSWGLGPGWLRGAARFGDFPHYRFENLGFRLARTFPSTL